MDTQEPPFGAVILAAGRSRRMGFPKAMLPWGGPTLLEAWVELLRGAGFGPVAVVVGVEAAMLQATGLSDVRWVHNPDPAASGLRESLILGLDALPADRPALFTPVDVPPTSREVLDALRGAWVDPEPFAVVPEHAGAPGHPVLVGSRFVARLFEGQPGDRIDHLLEWATRRTTRVAVSDPRVTADLDEPQAYERWAPRPG
jgi:molybdenum cofactor cytidylyltransferase